MSALVVCSCVQLIGSCRVSALAKRLLVCRAGLPCVGFGYVCLSSYLAVHRVSALAIRLLLCRAGLPCVGLCLICMGSFIELIGSCRVSALGKFARMSAVCRVSARSLVC